jgi:hypothetical protein
VGARQACRLWLAALDWVGGLLGLRLRLRLVVDAGADGMRPGGACQRKGAASPAVCLDGQLHMLTSEREREREQNGLGTYHAW